jgi:large subunit ribosomal protein L20
MSRSKTYHSAHETVLRAGNYARAGRKLKKRDFRALWVTRVSAACLSEDILYSRLIHGLKLANITLNRKMLSELAIHDPLVFTAIVQKAKEALGV